MKEQTNKLYRITTRLIETSRKGQFKAESSGWNKFDVIARHAEEAVNKCKFESDEILDEIELLNEDVIV
jgi:hypothetical protein